MLPCVTDPGTKSATETDEKAERVSETTLEDQEEVNFNKTLSLL